MNKILTISVAAYNVERFIQQTIESLIYNENIIDDIEILIIDDGGTDKTLEIAKKYANKYPQSVFLFHKENGGYGSVINYAIKHASGKYFKQLDGDDWFDSNNFANFIQQLKKIESDCIITPLYRFYEQKDYLELQDDFPKLPFGEYSCEQLKFEVGLRMYCCTFKTEYLKKMNYKITEHCLYTDTEYVNSVISYINKFYILHIPVYVYRIGREEQSVSRKNLIKHYKEHETVIFKIQNIYDSINSEDIWKRNIVGNRLRSEVCMQLKIYCMLPLSWNNFRKACNFLNSFKKRNKEIYKEVIHYSKFVKIWKLTNGIAYILLHFIV